jgi:hypothetical protein
MKLNLSGEDGANFAFNSGVFSTIDDGSAHSIGDQTASLEQMNAVESDAASFATTSAASFSMSGITAMSPATTFDGSLMVQNLDKGLLSIYGGDNTLLLEAELTLSAITGPLGSSDSQGLFLAYGEITGGTMAEGLDRGSLRVRMKLPDVQGGFSVSPAPNVPPPPVHFGALDSFTATTLSVEIIASLVPEPAGATLVAAGIAIVAVARRRFRR